VLRSEVGPATMHLISASASSLPVSPMHAEDDELTTALASSVTSQLSLEEWLSSYDNEKRCYTSAALEADIKLRRAEVFAHAGRSSNPSVPPDPLCTAVAFEVLDDVGRHCGRFQVPLSFPSLLPTAAARCPCPRCCRDG
jgi:hypothetical protein